MPLPLADVPAAPVYGLMAFAVVVTLVGHIAHDRRVVAVGVTVLFAATALLMLGAYLAYQAS